MHVRAAALAVLLSVLSGCGQAVCYADADKPRFSGRYALEERAASRLRIVSFNIKFSQQAEAAARLLRAHPKLRDADVVLLQEMDERGTDAIAQRLGLDYVYYPAVRHPEHGHNFGNAVLSRFPIVSDRKLVLPGRGNFGGAIRTATVAELAVGKRQLTVVSTHLSTPIELGFGSRRAQLNAVLRAALFGPAIVGGDFNDPELPAWLSRIGFTWCTRGVGGTSVLGRSLDHILAHGISSVRTSAGKVAGYPGISDHLPVYADLALAADE